MLFFPYYFILLVRLKKLDKLFSRIYSISLSPNVKRCLKAVKLFLIVSQKDKVISLSFEGPVVDDLANIIFVAILVLMILFQPYWKDKVGGDVGEDGISDSLALELIGD